MRDRVSTYDGREALESLILVIEAAAGERGRRSLIWYRLACMEHKDERGELLSPDAAYERYCKQYPLHQPGRQAFDGELEAVRAKQREMSDAVA